MAAGWAPREGARAGPALAGVPGPGRGARRPSASSALGAEDLLGAASRLFLPCSSCFSALGLDFLYRANCFKGRSSEVFPSHWEVNIESIMTLVFFLSVDR